LTPAKKIFILFLIILLIAMLCSCEEEKPEPRYIDTFELSGDTVYAYTKVATDTFSLPYARYFSAKDLNDVFSGLVERNAVGKDQMLFIYDRNEVFFERQVHSRFPFKATYQTFYLELTKDKETGKLAIARVPEQPTPVTRTFYLATALLALLLIAVPLIFTAFYALRVHKKTRKWFIWKDDKSLQYEFNLIMAFFTLIIPFYTGISLFVGNVDLFKILFIAAFMTFMLFLLGDLFGPLFGLLFKAIGELVRFVVLLPFMGLYGLLKIKESPRQTIEKALSYQIWKNGPPVLAWLLFAIYLAVNSIIVVSIENDATKIILNFASSLVLILVYFLTVPKRWKFERKEKTQDDEQ
jgi:hypothetical protein